MKSEIEILRERVDSTESWYAVRIERLADLCKQHGIWDDAAAILANETMTPTEPRSYSQILAGWKARAEKAEANYAFMVQRAVDGANGQPGLAAYRELGAKAAAAENEADRLRARLRDVAQILIAEVGADGPMEAEDAARKAVERMVLLRELADRSAAEAGLYAHRMGQAQEARRLAREEKARALWKQANQHVYREVTYDRDDRPIPPTCAHCGHAKDLCTGDKP